MTDRNGRIGERQRLEPRRNEALARQFQQHVEDILVVNVPAAHLLVNHLQPCKIGVHFGFSCNCMNFSINMFDDPSPRVPAGYAKARRFANYGESWQRGSAAEICLQLLNLFELFVPLVSGIGDAYRALIITTNDPT